MAAAAAKTAADFATEIRAELGPGALAAWEELAARRQEAKDSLERALAAADEWEAQALRLPCGAGGGQPPPLDIPGKLAAYARCTQRLLQFLDAAALTLETEGKAIRSEIEQLRGGGTRPARDRSADVPPGGSGREAHEPEGGGKP